MEVPRQSTQTAKRKTGEFKSIQNNGKCVKRQIKGTVTRMDEREVRIGSKK